jgi:hypothetical protein
MEDVDNPGVDPEYSFAEILMQSGCIKLSHGKNTTTNGVPEIGLCSEAGTGAETAPGNINVDNFKINFTNGSDYIFTAGTFTDIKDKVSAYIIANAEDFKDVGADCYIKYTFEYVPFAHETLPKWNDFIKNNSLAISPSPVSEYGNYLFRAYGDGYTPGRGVMANTSKLISFTSSYFGLLDNYPTRLHGIYVATNLGVDAKANTISDNTEYMLRTGERLYIEYTPSSTAEDGSTKTGDAVQEIYEAGTIIRPLGFEAGLMDSTAYAESHTPFKEVVFNETNRIGMHSLGTNEQIEIRDFAKVTLNEETFKTSPVVYVYKNFECYELENAKYNGGLRVNNSYTLKDGEYVFYTDENKAEYACFTSGTEIVLKGNTKIPQKDIIDIATILDNGPQDIPWTPLRLSGNDSIELVEYQYITLGPGDTLKNLTIVGSKDNRDNYLSSKWQYCDNVKYLPAGAEDPVSLAPISIYDDDSAGNGWEVCSILELNVSPNNPQTLRKTDKVTTSVTLKAANTTEETVLEPKEGYPISFKTNLACQTSGSSIKLSDLYNNPNNLDHFEVKVFADNAPAVIKTKPGTVIPYLETAGPVDMAKLPASIETLVTTYNKLWSAVGLKALATSTDDYENAIKFSVVTLPNTYGIFSIYLENSSNANTWIELLPGASLDNIELLNTSKTVEGNKIMLKAGLNCIKIASTCDLFIKTDSSSQGTLCFDNLRLIDVTDDNSMGLNIKQIGYFAIEESSGESQLLTDIRAIDKDGEFYYNVPVESSIAIDFDESSVTPDTLLNPFISYDINNINNNFVISKLDINQLSNGLQIARSSRIS